MLLDIECTDTDNIERRKIFFHYYLRDTFQESVCAIKKRFIHFLSFLKWSRCRCVDFMCFSLNPKNALGERTMGLSGGALLCMSLLKISWPSCVSHHLANHPFMCIFFSRCPDNFSIGLSHT